MDEIFGRRSVRKYRQQPIPDEQLTTLLRAAMRAPSAGNQQAWEFIVLRDRETMRKITEFHPYSGMLREADCAILVCGNGERSKFPQEYLAIDCSAATQNLLLEAVHLGIGAVWLGVYPLEERMHGLRQLLGLPDFVIPINLVALGYPAEEPTPIDTFLPERIHRERWNPAQS